MKLPGLAPEKCQSLSCIWLFVTPWTIVHQAPLSMEFPSKNTGVGCHPLLQGIFLTQGSNLGLLHCRQILYSLNHQGWPLDSCILNKFLRWLWCTLGSENLCSMCDHCFQVFINLSHVHMEKTMATHSSTLAWKNPMGGGAW